MSQRWRVKKPAPKRRQSSPLRPWISTWGSRAGKSRCHPTKALRSCAPGLASYWGRMPHRAGQRRLHQRAHRRRFLGLLAGLRRPQLRRRVPQLRQRRRQVWQGRRARQTRNPITARFRRCRSRRFRSDSRQATHKKHSTKQRATIGPRSRMMSASRAATLQTRYNAPMRLKQLSEQFHAGEK